MPEISITEAKGKLSEIISRAAGGERFIVQRRSRPIAAVISVAELQRLERSGQAARKLARALGQRAEILEEVEHGNTHPAMAAFGLWRDEEELEDLASRIAENRRIQPTRHGSDT